MSKNIKWLLACLVFVIVSACASKSVMVNYGTCKRVDGLPAHLLECKKLDDSVRDQIELEP